LGILEQGSIPGLPYAEIPDEAEDGHGKAGGKGEKVFLREYEAGRLLREDFVSAEEMEAVFGPFRRRAKDKAERRQRHRRRVGKCALQRVHPQGCLYFGPSSERSAGIHAMLGLEEALQHSMVPGMETASKARRACHVDARVLGNMCMHAWGDSALLVCTSLIHMPSHMDSAVIKAHGSML